ncbi:hypothetical protein ICE98_00431 [Lactococcus lactis]|nr:hypothetical protein [Lactococcus lactis]
MSDFFKLFYSIRQINYDFFILRRKTSIEAPKANIVAPISTNVSSSDDPPVTGNDLIVEP